MAAGKSDIEVSRHTFVEGDVVFAPMDRELRSYAVGVIYLVHDSAVSCVVNIPDMYNKSGSQVFPLSELILMPEEQAMLWKLEH